MCRFLRYSEKKDGSLISAGANSLKTLFLILALLLGLAEPQHTIGSGFSATEVDAYVIPQGPHWLCERVEDESDQQPVLLSSVALNALIASRSAVHHFTLQQAERPRVSVHPIRAPPGFPLQTFT